MKSKMISNLYQFECSLFHSVNKQYEKKIINPFFHFITHLGGALFTIFATLAIILFTTSPIKYWGLESACALLFSHLIVTFVKKKYPRTRPYLALHSVKVTPKPLKDHSFPSGHTTAIFSMITPFVIHMPILAYLLIPIALSVGISRIYLGLHYPSDVLAGMLLGTSWGGIITTLFAMFFTK